MQVAQIAARGALQSSGQNCAGAERFYVHKDVYSSFVTEVVKIVKSVTAVSNFSHLCLLLTRCTIRSLFFMKRSIFAHSGFLAS